MKRKLKRRNKKRGFSWLSRPCFGLDLRKGSHKKYYQVEDLDFATVMLSTGMLAVPLTIWAYNRKSRIKNYDYGAVILTDLEFKNRTNNRAKCKLFSERELKVKIHEAENHKTK